MKTVLCSLLCILFSTALVAQVGEEPKPEQPEPDEQELETADYFKEIDTDKDGKVTLKELKSHVLKESEAADEKQGEFLSAFQTYLGEYLSADGDDDLKLTRDEYKTFLGKKLKDDAWKPPLSRKDADTIKAELFEPFADAILKVADTDADGAVSRAEAKAMNGGVDVPEDEWKAVDSDNDGKALRSEWTALMRKQSELEYEFPKEKAAGETEEPDADEKPADEDPWALYRKKGRLWVHKSQLVFPDMTITTYAKEEVLEVTDTYAKIRRTSWGEGKEDTPSTMEITIEFKNPERLPKNKYKTEETIKVKAGEFECYKYSVENAKRSRTEWWHKKYPLLEVKTVAKDTHGTTTTELTEFKD